MATIQITRGLACCHDPRSLMSQRLLPLFGVVIAVAAVVHMPDARLLAQRADQLVARNASIAEVEFKGRSALRVVADPTAPNASSYATVNAISFRDGTIEMDVAGQPAAGAFEAARGFIGIAFRLQPDGSYEYIYLRP